MTRILPFLLIAACSGWAQHAGHEDHHQGVDRRGDHVMGFSHEKTRHHFLLHADGGTIQVEALDQADTASRDQIRGHLKHIAKMFSEGNFRAPILIHAQTPPGAPVLQKMKEHVKYDFKPLERGAAVEIRTANAEALNALHEFLRFQIADHRTADPTTITPRR